MRGITVRSMRFSSWMWVWRRAIGSGGARGKARETMKTVTFMASVLKSLAPVIGCTDSTEQRLTQAQNELAQVFRTAWRNGGIRMQRAGRPSDRRDCRTVALRYESYDFKPGGIEVLK